MKPKLASLAFPIFISAFLLVLFAPVLGYYQVLNTPDSAPYYTIDHAIVLLRSLLQPVGGRLLHPGLLPALVLPPLVYHDLHYALCTLAVCAATVYYLRGLRLRWSAALCGGFAMAFSGYHFTLISAGHRGYFDMMPWAILMLAWVDRTLRAPRPRYAVSAVIALGFGLSPQPDVMILFVMLTACYAVVMSADVFRAIAPEARKPWAHRVALSGAAALPALLLAVAAPLGHVFVALVPHREAQIAQSAAVRPAQPAEKPAAPSRDETWIFATNWSLPPGETLELIAPFVFGIDTYHPERPYWGALGRAPQWDEYQRQVAAHLATQVPLEQRAQQREMLLRRARNLRQHTTYLGAIPLLFGLLALLWGGSARRNGRQPAGQPAAPPDMTGGAPSSPPTSDAPAGRPDPIALRTVTRFWAVAAAVALLLAFGRYTPAYRLFFALPMMDKLRAPVKFLHLTELAVAVLFAIGVDLALRFGAAEKPLGRKFLRTTLALGGLGAIVLLLSAAVPFWRTAAQSTMGAVGLPSTAIPLLTQGARRALAHGGLALAAGTALLAAMGSGWTCRRGLPAAACLLPVLMLDVYVVSSPFIRAVDVGGIYRPNPVIDVIQRANANASYRVSNLLGGTGWHDPLSGALRHHRIPRTEPGSAGSAYAELYQALAENPARLWTATGTRFIIGEARRLEPLVRHPEFDARLGFDLDRLGQVRGVGDTGRLVLVERRNAEPFAQVFYDWAFVEAGGALDAMRAPDAPLGTRLWVESGGDLLLPVAPRTPPGAARTLRRAGQSLRNRTRLEAEAAAPALLLVRQAYREQARVRVNGQPAPLLRVNHAWRGIPLTAAGTHAITIDEGASYWRLATALGAMILLAGLWVRTGIAGKRSGR